MCENKNKITNIYNLFLASLKNTDCNDDADGVHIKTRTYSINLLMRFFSYVNNLEANGMMIKIK